MGCSMSSLLLTTSDDILKERNDLEGVDLMALEIERIIKECV